MMVSVVPSLREQSNCYERLRVDSVLVDAELVEIAKTAIGEHYGLTPGQAARLRGENRQEIEDDAKLMRRELGLPPLDDDRRDEHGRFRAADMNQVIRQASGRR